MTKKKSDKTKITRISASDDKAKKAASSDQPSTTVKKTKVTAKDSKASTKSTSVVKEATTAKEQSSPKNTKAEKKPTKEKKGKKDTSGKKKLQNPIDAYFSGAWSELKQVRWPDRSETWTMTVGLLAFTIFSIILILLLDAIFKYLFKLTIGG